MTVTPKDPAAFPEPHESRARRAIRRAGIVTATAVTVTVTTIIWPVVATPVATFIAAAALTIEAVRMAEDDDVDRGCQEQRR